MKKLILMAALLATTNAMANPVNLCITEHLNMATKNPSMNYETDRGVLKIWCQCKHEQRKLGKTEDEVMEFCYVDTDDVINKHLKMGRYSKQ